MRVFVITLGFANPLTINETFRRTYSTKTSFFTHVVINQHYPLPSDEEATANLKRLCAQHGAVYYDPGENLGLAAGFNYAIEACALKDDDIVIGLDPDTMPETPGWDAAMIKTFIENPTIGWVSLWNDVSSKEIEERGYDVIENGGITLIVTKQAVLNSICAWRAGWLKKVGGLSEPNKFYGGLESTMFPKLREHGLHWAFIREFKESRTDVTQKGFDTEYFAYKMDYAHNKTWSGDFASYLEKNKKR